MREPDLPFPSEPGPPGFLGVGRCTAQGKSLGTKLRGRKNILFFVNPIKKLRDVQQQAKGKSFCKKLQVSDKNIQIASHR